MGTSLIAQYIDIANICIFHNNPPGRHDAFAVGGDEDKDPGEEGVGMSAASTVGAAGLSAGAIGAFGGSVVAFADGRPVGSPEDVLTGFVDANGDALGRPVGVAVDRAGALLVADDVGNVIWRVMPATSRQ